MFKIRSDIVDVLKEMNKPVYDLIIGVETMTKMGVIIDFSTKMLVIDKSVQPMKPLENLKDTNSLNNLNAFGTQSQNIGRIIVKGI